MPRWFWYLSITAILAAIIYPHIAYEDTIYIACTYAIVEGFILVVVLSILRKLNMFDSWKLIEYHAIVVIASIFVNYLLSSFHLHFGDPQHKIYFLLSYSAVFAFFIFLNFMFSKTTFVINILKASLLGLIKGFINAFLVISTTAFYK